MPTFVSWNVWGGSGGDGLFSTLSELAQYVDVFGLQEVHNAPYTVPQRLMPAKPGDRLLPINTWLLREIETVVGPDFVSYYAPQLTGCYHDCEQAPYPDLCYGNVLLVRKRLTHCVRQGFISGELNKLTDRATSTPAGKTGLAVDLHDLGITFCTGHGAWYYSDKGNLPWRTEQAKRLLTLADPNYDQLTLRARDPSFQTSVILAGDLNVRRDTDMVSFIKQSRVFGPHGADYLNERFGSHDTRTRLYKKPDREANHAFASPHLQARLTILPEVSSDHAVLLIEC
jgi:hypothetical protein